MEERIKRHKFLSKLLHEHGFSSQEDVVEAMEKAGYAVTQSSISRDFRELGVIKIGGRYLPSSELKGEADTSAFQKMIMGVDTAGANLVVVKTKSGCANAVAEQMDLTDIAGVVGTVAGDNTFFVATKNKSAQTRVVAALRNIR